ncbi:MAG: HEPN domain-containing protein [Ignavibacteriae bacterium]|nr:HEPN domain-containing protein [Ignavibacteriota bacterium]
MMTKQEHIQYWINSSEEDWKTVLSLFQSGRYVHCLFFAHLTLEKLCKAIWVKSNEDNFPPKTHNLIKLLNETNQNFIEEDLAFLSEFNDFQLEGRYPDYLFEINKRCNNENTTSILNKVKSIRLCLQEKLQ